MFSLTRPASMQIYWNKRKHLHKKRIQLPQELELIHQHGRCFIFWNTNMAAMTSCQPPNNNSLSLDNIPLMFVYREIKIHVYSIRQTANVSGEFLRIENKQLKKVQNDSCGQNYHKTTYFCVEAINGKRKIGGKLGHVVQIHVCRLA